MTLDETGYLHCAYLGTDPSMMVTPAPEARDINYEVSAADFFKLSGCKIYLQGSYGSWKVLAFYSDIFQDWKVLESAIS